MLSPVDQPPLPGLRDFSGKDTSPQGVNEILEVVDHLASGNIPSCVIGVKALRYYGAAREWDLCIPDDKLEEACHVLLSTAGGDKYEVAQGPHPVPWSRRHTFTCFRLKGYNFWFILVPSSDCFVDPSTASHVEKSRNGVPYASLVQFSRSLLLQQMVADISDFIDGMDLTVDWGTQNIGFEALQKDSACFIERRNEHATVDSGRYGFLSSQSLEQLWNEMASKEAKERRIEPMKQGRYFTRWRRIKSPEDPRTKDRPV
ncbi:hypothetical protein CHGG_10663 [Chaetomium globosum CBS 148.51]|uniref:Uncharacterized protein n=1 Tax=Chaetomium globosum (strain ATCC 6205 / CBS 148.51 / DSM 1962 / NBRC 6347 / NRRL 1970) TaxID=306901 RepID=Q2GMZ1_CHAGB|nr:uncharacterized protein CHGG_10663 [Chaetomium globosum CBS 148.51]EAQ84259.1 hypothetical protein CHGG_10663 [Chaetomium globosum CBS 148.51]